MSENAYKQAGVDVEAGYESVRLIKDDVKKTAIEGVLGGIGGFGGLFEMPKNYENPVLVSGTDGVGTKIRVAFLMDKHDTIGQDCVAMCVNDIAQLLNISTSAISHQLRILKQAQLVKFRREGKTIFYSLSDDHVRTILNQGMEHICE